LRVADAIAIAIVWADPVLAGRASVPLEAVALPFVAQAIASACTRAGLVSTVLAKEACVALTLARDLIACAVIVAVAEAAAVLACVPKVGGDTVAPPLDALAVEVAVVLASKNGAVLSSVLVVALALAVLTRAVATAVVVA
jgi:hypothetical protein